MQERAIGTISAPTFEIKVAGTLTRISLLSPWRANSFPSFGSCPFWDFARCGLTGKTVVDESPKHTLRDDGDSKEDKDGKDDHSGNEVGDEADVEDKWYL